MKNDKNFYIGALVSACFMLLCIALDGCISKNKYEQLYNDCTSYKFKKNMETNRYELDKR